MNDHKAWVGIAFALGLVTGMLVWIILTGILNVPPLDLFK